MNNDKNKAAFVRGFKAWVRGGFFDSHSNEHGGGERPTLEDAVEFARDRYIAAGDKVRSFDFESHALAGPRASYVEGAVVEITDPATHPRFRDVPRYRIVVSLRKGGGEILTVPEGFEVYPPVNGVPTLMGGVTRNVELILV